MLITAQILLVAVVVVLTALLVLIGIQVYQVLSELKKASRSLNQILDNTAQASKALSQPIVSFSLLMSSLRAILGKSGKQDGGKRKN